MARETNHSATVCSRCSIMAVVALLAGLSATQASCQEPPKDLMELPLEALMNLEVTSVSRKPQRLRGRLESLSIGTPHNHPAAAVARCNIVNRLPVTLCP